MKNRIFFPQGALDEWLSEDRMELRDDELTITGEGRTYKILEAIRIVREVTESPDVHEIVGKVKSRSYLMELGAELLESSMVLGDNAYDVVPGFIGAPVGSFAEHRTRKGQPDSDELTNDEQLLASFLLGQL